jgi:hypothetical protein
MRVICWGMHSTQCSLRKIGRANSVLVHLYILNLRLLQHHKIKLDKLAVLNLVLLSQQMQSHSPD